MSVLSTDDMNLFYILVQVDHDLPIPVKDLYQRYKTQALFTLSKIIGKREFYVRLRRLGWKQLNNTWQDTRSTWTWENKPYPLQLCRSCKQVCYNSEFQDGPKDKQISHICKICISNATDIQIKILSEQTAFKIQRNKRVYDRGSKAKCELYDTFEQVIARSHLTPAGLFFINLIMNENRQLFPEFPGNYSSKSAKYQYKYSEISVDPETLILIKDNKETPEQMQIRHAQEDLKYALFCRFQDMINELGTPKQKEVFKLHILEGKTQTEIAKELKMHQPAVHKFFYGNIYKYNGVKTRHGGLVIKLRKAVKEDVVCNDIIKQLQETGLYL